MNKSSWPRSEEDLRHDGWPNELRSLWSRFSPLLTECEGGKQEGRSPTGACERRALGSWGSRPPNDLVLAGMRYYLLPPGLMNNTK